MRPTLGAVLGAFALLLLIGARNNDVPAVPMALPPGVTAPRLPEPVCVRKGYSRAKFGNHPSSAVRKAIYYLRQTEAGGWRDEYTGETKGATTGLEVDHVVPLAYAWDHGACNWTTGLRILFATDPSNLALTIKRLNAGKGDSGPEKWLPPIGKCEYVKRFEALVREYRLQVDPAIPGAIPVLCLA